MTASAGVASVRRTKPASLPFVFVNLTLLHHRLLVRLCPCVVYSKNRQRIRSLQTQGTPLANGGETYDSHCCIYGGFDITGYSWIMQVCLGERTFHKMGIQQIVPLQIRTREEVRERYGIRGDAIGDCFASWCCRPCTLTQECREIELEENSL